MEQPVQAFFLQGVETTDVDDAVADLAFIEEGQAFYVKQHAADRFGNQGDIKDFASCCCLIEANLIPKDSFTDSGRAFDDVQAAAKEAALENVVETFYAGGHARELMRIFTIHPFPRGLIGSVTVKREPAPGVPITVMEPPIDSASLRVSHRPIPKPPRPSRPTTRSNCSKMRSLSLPSMPIPLSRRAIWAKSLAVVKVSSIGLCSPYLIALESKFSTISETAS